MKQRATVFLWIIFVLLFGTQYTFAEVPIIDESENFITNNDTAQNLENDEMPLAHDDILKDNAASMNTIQNMQQEIQELRGQLEIQMHELQVLKLQQVEFSKDVNSRLHPNNPAPTSPAPNTPELNNSIPTMPGIVLPKTNTNNNNPADEQISYMSAYEFIRKKQFDSALSAMQLFIAKYPQGAYAANAHYWLGELYLVNKNYDQAILHFQIVHKQFAHSSKDAASMLKIGYALSASGKIFESRQILQQVIKTYPDTETANLAKAKLKALQSF